jgi:hypothetical protein
MSITIELPADIESRIRAIPDLEQRMVEFLRHQAALEEWRGRRYCPEAQTIVTDALAEAERLRQAGLPREQAFRELREAREEIGRHV